MEDLSNLIVPKRFIYCEGRDLPNSKGEACGLDEIAYNNIFEEKYPETLFVSSGGSTELEQRSTVALAVLSKALKDVEIWILKDRDMCSGKETSENQRQIYLENNDNNHRVLKRYEIENYLFDDEAKLLLNYIKNWDKIKDYIEIKRDEYSSEDNEWWFINRVLEYMEELEKVGE